MWVDNAIFTDDRTTIENFISYRSKALHKHITSQRLNTYYTMWHKSLTHSDLTTRGKRTNSNEGFERNLLYYLSVTDMEELQSQFPEKRFECAKQSNIGMPEEFYRDIGVPRIHRRSGQQTEKHNWVSLNDYMQVFLVNDSLEYFTLDYSESIMKHLGKELPSRWKKTEIVLNSDSQYTEIDLHQAVHGLGVEADKVFHALRLTMFLNDAIIFVVEHNETNPKLFILLEKNTPFYPLLGIKDKKWASDERIRRYQERVMIKEGVTIEIPKNLYENKWDDVFLP